MNVIVKIEKEALKHLIIFSKVEEIDELMEQKRNCL